MKNKKLQRVFSRKLQSFVADNWLTFCLRWHLSRLCHARGRFVWGRVSVYDVVWGCERGVSIIVCFFFRSEFDSCCEKFICQDDVPNITITLRTAARKAAIGTGQGYARCVCYKGCNNNRCLCKKKGLLCNSKCHNSLGCANK